MDWAHHPAGRGRPLHTHPRHVGLLALLHGKEGADQRPTDAGRITARHGLLAFLRTPTPTLVAATQGGNSIGDIRDKEAKCLATAASNRPRLHPDGRLTQSAAAEKMECSPPKVPGADGYVEEIESSSMEGEPFPDFETEPTAPFPPEPLPEHTEVKLMNTLAQGQDSKQGHQGPWWKELLSSPVKRLCRSNWNNPFGVADAPSFNLPPAITPPVVVKSKKTKVLKSSPTAKRRRNDIPDSKRRSVLNIPKAGLRGAVAWAKSREARERAVKNLEAAFYANSSRAAKSSKRKTIMDILAAAKENYPLTPFSIKLIAATLKEAGYKSAYTYLIEAKSYHLELGHDWTHSLDRWFKLSINAAKRGMGPRKKAKEVPESEWSNFSLLTDQRDKATKVRLPMHLFATGVHWMLREIEVAALTCNDVKLDSKSRMVTLKWTESKTDTSARGISRTMQCICPDTCDLKCPYAVMELLANHAALKGAPQGLLATTFDNTEVTKAELVKSWNSLFGPGISGHSPRRSGALQYIRRGWAVAQVGYLGRWKSSIILEYAQEALETMAVNVDKKFGINDLVKDSDQVDAEMRQLAPSVHASMPLEPEVKLAMVKKLETELSAFKANSTEAKNKLAESIKELNLKFEGSTKYLPRLVKSHRNQVVHLNTKALVYAPSHLWKTVCGWHYYNSTYEFMAGEPNMVTCNKCFAAAQGREEMDAA